MQQKTTGGARGSRQWLTLWALCAAGLMMSAGLWGCGQDEPQAPAKPATTTTPTPTPTTTHDGAGRTANAGDTRGAADAFAIRAPAAPAPLPVNRRFAEVGLVVSGPQELGKLIEQVKVAAIVPGQVAGPAAEALRQSREKLGLLLGERVLEITPPASAANGALLPADLRLSLPLSAEQRKGATAHNVGAVYLSPRGPVAIKGFYDQANAAVIVHVPHLSSFISFRRDPKAELTQYIAEEASKRAWAKVENIRGKIEEKLIESAEDYLKKQAFDKLDGGVKRSILVGLVKHRGDLANLFSSSGAQDPTTFCQTFQVLLGKVIVDQVPASKLRSVLEAVTENTETIATVAEAGGQAAGGDYWAAIEILGKAYAQTTPIYQYTVQAAAIMDAGWSLLKDDALEEFYKEYQAGTFVPERVSRRMDLMMYLQRKFPKPDGKKMSDAETVKFVEDNFQRRQLHEKETAEWEADLKQIHAWYSQRIFLEDKIKERFNETNGTDCFRRFLRILDAIDGHLVRLGICRPPWGPKGEFQPQTEMLELVQAFEKGGAREFQLKVKEIERRLARPLDLRGYTGFWILAKTDKIPAPPRKGWTSDGESYLKYESKQTAPTTYTGAVELKTTQTKEAGGKVTQVPYTYKASATAGWDELPPVVPNGTDWDVMVRASMKESCTMPWNEAAPSLAGNLGAWRPPASKGESPRFVPCHVGIMKSEENRLRVLGDAEIEARKASYVSASAEKPWNDAVAVKFPLIPASTVTTAERFILTLEAHTPGGTFRETYSYEWAKQLPKKWEPELHRQVSRANFRGHRSDKVDMSSAAKAQAAAPPDTAAKTVTGSKVVLKDLRFVPQPVVAQKEAAFEVSVENGPRVPSYSWYFGTSPGSKQADAWTTVPQCKFTYFKAGTYTVTVKIRDKNKYSQGDLAVGSWQVVVEPEK
jgi:hypothetical protein